MPVIFPANCLPTLAINGCFSTTSRRLLTVLNVVLAKSVFEYVDVFAGSGVVSRFLKAHASLLVSNDFEDYAAVVGVATFGIEVPLIFTALRNRGRPECQS